MENERKRKATAARRKHIWKTGRAPGQAVGVAETLGVRLEGREAGCGEPECRAADTDLTWLVTRSQQRLLTNRTYVNLGFWLIILEVGRR